MYRDTERMKTLPREGHTVGSGVPAGVADVVNQARRTHIRGFSLVELMLAITIISVTAALAAPAISRRLRDRRTNELAQRTSMTFRDARMRSQGRGAAVLVRFTAGTQGTLEVREAMAPTTDNCPGMPETGCTTRVWDDSDSTRVKLVNIANRNEYYGMRIRAFDEAGSEQPSYEVCYSPVGGAQSRIPGGNWRRMTGVPALTVRRYSGGAGDGLERRIFVLPNGTSRLSL